jgi:hypothetical protein
MARPGYKTITRENVYVPYRKSQYLCYQGNSPPLHPRERWRTTPIVRQRSRCGSRNGTARLDSGDHRSVQDAAPRDARSPRGIAPGKRGRTKQWEHLGLMTRAGLMVEMTSDDPAGADESKLDRKKPYHRRSDLDPTANECRERGTR